MIPPFHQCFPRFSRQTFKPYSFRVDPLPLQLNTTHNPQERMHPTISRNHSKDCECDSQQFPHHLCLISHSPLPTRFIHHQNITLPTFPHLSPFSLLVQMMAAPFFSPLSSSLPASFHHPHNSTPTQHHLKHTIETVSGLFILNAMQRHV